MYQIKEEYEEVVSEAQDRSNWKLVVAKVTDVFCKLREEKIMKKREARKAREFEVGEKKLL